MSQAIYPNYFQSLGFNDLKRTDTVSTSSRETCTSSWDIDCLDKGGQITEAHTQERRNKTLSPKEYNKSNMKHKLELCRKFMETGFCGYASRCTFAHGSHELRQNQKFNARYKTKECEAFFQNGHCRYGNRCNFLHCHQETPEEKWQKQRLMRLNYMELMSKVKGHSRLLQVLGLGNQ